MDKNIKLKISDFVFYRQYNEQVILFCTNNEKAYIFNAETKTLLDFFKEYVSIKEYLDSLSDFNISDAEQEELILFFETLVSEGILIKETILVEESEDALVTFHRESLSTEQLYSVFFELTYKCNEKCKFCYCIDDKTKKELNAEEIKQTLDELSKMNVMEVTFSGGDPFVRKDFFEILEYARSKNFLINIFTNGNLISDSDIFRLKSLNIKSIHFSIYSSVPEKHDEFTQLSGSFEKTIDVIKKCKLINISTNIKTTILNFNLDDMNDIFAIAKDLGTSIQTGVTVSLKNDGSNEPKKFALSSISEYVKAIKTINGNIKNTCSMDFSNLIEEGADCYICGAGKNILSINPYGEVFPCNSLMISCGNIRKETIFNIWHHSKVLQQVRNLTMSMVKGCSDCKNKAFCGFCPGNAQMETGDPLSKYSEACLITEALKIYKNKENTVK